MKRSSSTEPHIVKDLIIVVFCVGVAWFVRFQLIAEKSISFTANDSIGLISDIGVAALFAFLALNALRIGRWFVAPLLIAWGVANIIIYEFTSFFDASDAIRHAGFLGDATFFQGSASSVSNFVVFGIIIASMVIAIVVSGKRTPTNMMIGASAGAMLLGIGANFLLPDAPEVDAWRQENFVYSNFLPEAEQDPLSMETIALTPELEGLFKPDLGGASKLIGQPDPVKKPNVLLVILESVSGAQIPSIAKHHGVTYDIRLKHLDKLAKSNFTLSNFVTNQRKTNRGEYALLCGDYPKLNTGEAKMSEFVRGGNRECLPKLMADAGYETIYLQAAPTAFMLKDRFMTKIGYDQVHGDEYFDRNEYRHTPWGVDDLGFFEESEKLVRELNQKEEPWFLTLLNVGTHHPFDIPSDYRSPGPQDAHARAFRYADDSFETFIENLKKDKQFENTLVIVTTDESIGLRQGFTDADRSLSKNWGFLIAFGPRVPRAWVNEPFGQTDLGLSILDYVDEAERAPHFVGRSLFRHYTAQRPIFFGNVYSAKTFRADPDGVMTRCDSTYEQCTSTTFEPGRMFSRNQPLGPLKSDRVEELRSIVARTAATGFDVRRVQELELVTTDRMELAETQHEQVLFGGQYLYIPKNTRVDVDIEVEVEGDDGSLAGFDLIVKGNKHVLLNRPLPILRVGEKMRVKYSRYIGEDRDRFEARFYARHMSPGKKTVVRFKTAKMYLEPTEHTVNRGSNVIRELKIFRSPKPSAVTLSTDHPLQFRGKPCGQRFNTSWIFSGCGEQVVLYGPYLPIEAGTKVTFEVDVEGLSGEVDVVADLSSGIGRFDYKQTAPVTIKRGDKHTFRLEYTTETSIDDMEARVRAAAKSRFERFKVTRAVATFEPPSE